MNSEIITTQSQFEGLKEEWAALHHAAHGSLFQSHDWLAAWLRVFKNRVKVRALVLRENGRLAGVVPCFIEPFRAGIIPVRRLRFMGEYEIYGVYEPLYLAQYRVAVVAAAMEFFEGMFVRKEVDVVDFHHFPSDSEFIDALIHRTGERRLTARFERNSLVHLVLDVPSDWESYQSRLTRNDRQSRNRHERVIFKNGAVLEVVPASGDEKAFRDFVDLHTKTWRTRGKGGFFHEREGFGEFMREVTTRSTVPGRAQWFFLQKDGIRFAAIMAFYNGPECVLYLSGRDPSHELSRYGPGIVLMHLAIKDAIRRGCKTLDLLEGGTPYKYTLGTRDAGFGRLSLCRKGGANLAARAYFAATRFGKSVLWTKHLEPRFTQWRLGSPSEADSASSR